MNFEEDDINTSRIEARFTALPYVPADGVHQR